MVKCVECGFLGKKALDTYIPQPTHEMTINDRESGCNPASWFIEPTLRPNEPNRPVTLQPVCFRGCFDILQNWREPVEGLSGSELLKHILDKERECTAWYLYRSGFSPERHLEQQREEKLEALRQEFELALYQKSEHLERRSRKVGYWIAGAGVFLALGQIIAAILALTPESLIFK